jgi:hypothetical protein
MFDLQAQRAFRGIRVELTCDVVHDHSDRGISDVGRDERAEAFLRGQRGRGSREVGPAHLAV